MVFVSTSTEKKKKKKKKKHQKKKKKKKGKQPISQNKSSLSVEEPITGDSLTHFHRVLLLVLFEIWRFEPQKHSDDLTTYEIFSSALSHSDYLILFLILTSPNFILFLIFTSPN